MSVNQSQFDWLTIEQIDKILKKPIKSGNKVIQRKYDNAYRYIRKLKESKTDLGKVKPELTSDIEDYVNLILKGNDIKNENPVEVVPVVNPQGIEGNNTYDNANNVIMNGRIDVQNGNRELERPQIRFSSSNRVEERPQVEEVDNDEFLLEMDIPVGNNARISSSNVPNSGEININPDNTNEEDPVILFMDISEMLMNRIQGVEHGNPDLDWVIAVLKNEPYIPIVERLYSTLDYEDVRDSVKLLFTELALGSYYDKYIESFDSIKVELGSAAEADEKIKICLMELCKENMNEIATTMSGEEARKYLTGCTTIHEIIALTDFDRGVDGFFNKLFRLQNEELYKYIFEKENVYLFAYRLYMWNMMRNRGENMMEEAERVSREVVEGTVNEYQATIERVLEGRTDGDEMSEMIGNALSGIGNVPSVNSEMARIIEREIYGNEEVAAGVNTSCNRVVEDDKALSDEENELVRIVLNDCGELRLNDPTKKKGVGLKNKRVLLTYSGKRKKDVLKEYLLGLLRGELGRDVKIEIYIAHENGKRGEYPHTHVLIVCDKEIRTSSYLFFDVVGGDMVNGKWTDWNKHPHIRAVKTDTHFRNCLRYLAKEDTENKYLLYLAENVVSEKGKSSIQKLLEPKYDVDAMVEHGEMRDNLNIKALRNASKQKKQMEIRNFAPVVPMPTGYWQKNMIDEFRVLKGKKEGQKIERNVIWIYDAMGESGKTWLAKYLQSIDGSSILYINNVELIEKSNNLMGVVSSALMMDDWNREYIIIDIPKFSKPKSNFYTAIENLKDGIICNSRGSINIDKPKIYIFSNFLPNIDGLTYRRWDIRMITNDDKGYIPIDLANIDKSTGRNSFMMCTSTVRLKDDFVYDELYDGNGKVIEFIYNGKRESYNDNFNPIFDGYDKYKEYFLINKFILKKDE